MLCERKIFLAFPSIKLAWRKHFISNAVDKRLFDSFTRKKESFEVKIERMRIEING